MTEIERRQAEITWCANKNQVTNKLFLNKLRTTCQQNMPMIYNS